MVKNKIGGKGHKKSKRITEDTNKQIIYKEDQQEYGKVTKLLGNCHCLVLSDDGVERQCAIRGNMRKRIWIAKGDFVLISLRSFQDYKADIILKYSIDDTRNLIKSNEIKNLKIEINEINEDNEDEDEYIDFDIDAEDDNYSATNIKDNLFKNQNRSIEYNLEENESEYESE